MRVSIDLEERTLTFGDARVSFDIDPFSRRCLLQGVDELGFLLAQEPPSPPGRARGRMRALIAILPGDGIGPR